MDLALDRTAQGHQQESEVGGDVHLFRGDADVAVHPAALEVQDVAFPAPFDVELLRQVFGDVLDLLARLGEGRACERLMSMLGMRDPWPGRIPGPAYSAAISRLLQERQMTLC